MRSMFSGVSGLKAHQAKMDVIGNNIANVNTVGFKSGRVTFKEVFSQTIKGSGGADSATARAGTNPMQIGLGVGVSSIDTIMTRGSSERTDNPTDLSIEGDGFFILKGSTSDTYKFTRAGNFAIDELGNLNLSGKNVCGWEYDEATKSFDTSSPVKGINLYRDYASGKNKQILAAQPTTQAYIGGNLDSTTATAETFNVPMVVYDALGNEYKSQMIFTKVAPVQSGTTSRTTWNLTTTGTIKDAKDNDITKLVAIDPTTASVTFDENGMYVPPATATDIKLNITPADAMGTTLFGVKLNLSSLTMFSSDSSAKPTDVNGYPPGTLTTFNVGTDGIITGIYSNGEQQALGMVGVTTFANPGGLTKVGENLFIPSTNSGDYSNGVAPGTTGAGSLNPGTLEMSNVDLSKEFTDMIITQRGFQANSRIITTSDEMLQELVNLKR